MTVFGADWPTLSDVARRTDPNGSIAKIGEVLHEQNEILDDVPFIEGNLEIGHKGTVRTALPTVYWRLLNRGVPLSKSRTSQFVDTCGMLEAFSHVDCDVAKMNGNEREFRWTEDKAFVESMNQEFVETLFYGNSGTDPEEFLGFMPRYSDPTAVNGENILDGGGCPGPGYADPGDLTSILIVVWSDSTVHGIFPKGTRAGLMTEDLGRLLVRDEDDLPLMAYVSHFQWKMGLHVKDWRHIIRIANISMEEVIPSALTGPNLINTLVEALEQIPNLNAGRPAIYVNRRIRTALRLQISNKNNVHLSIEEVAGRKVLAFDGVPVRRCDALNIGEEPVIFA
jgi:hypothetical protein